MIRHISLKGLSMKILMARVPLHRMWPMILAATQLIGVAAGQQTVLFAETNGADESTSPSGGPYLVQPAPYDIVPGSLPTAAATEFAAQPAGPTWDQYQALLQRLEATERRLDAVAPGLGPIVDDQKRVVADGNPAVPSPEQRLGALEKLFKKTSGPNFPTARLTGFLHLDAGDYSQDAASRATFGSLQDGVGFRRARLQALGSVTEFTNYSIEMDFATAGRPSFMDVWGEQTHVPLIGNLRIGHYRQPFSMDSLTPVRQLQFLERALPFQAFDPFRRVGVMGYDKSDSQMTSWAYGIYRTGGFNNAPLGDSRYATDIGNMNGASVIGRMTHLLYYDEAANGRYLLHVGGAYNYSAITGSDTAGTPFYQARVIPEFFVGYPEGVGGFPGGTTGAGTPFFADTGRIASKQFQIFNLQLAGQYGAWNFQSEYMGTLVDQRVGQSLYYDGAYFQTGYFLTGENRTYNRMFGVFDRVVPFSDFFGLGRKSRICGWGAWELTGRWSYVNLNDPRAIAVGTPGNVPPPVSPNPGRMNDTTVGLNWYWNAYTKVQFNWIHVFLDNALHGNSNTDIFATRFQVEF